MQIEHWNKTLTKISLQFYLYMHHQNPFHFANIEKEGLSKFKVFPRRGLDSNLPICSTINLIKVLVLYSWFSVGPIHLDPFHWSMFAYKFVLCQISAAIVVSRDTKAWFGSKTNISLLVDILLTHEISPQKRDYLRPTLYTLFF